MSGRLSPLAKLARLLALLVAAAAFALLGYTLARRMLYPYDLEWMEGGMLCHSLRLLEGKPIYAPPSVDFIPYLYTPLYPALVAALAKIGGLTYPLARALSIASYGGASYLGYRFIRGTTGSRAAGLLAMAIPAAAYVRTGTFYDLARPDSLWLGLVTAGIIAVYRAARDGAGRRRTDRERHLLALIAALLLIAAFFAKQTGAPLIVAAGLALLVLDWRLVPTFGATLVAVGPLLLWLCNRSSDGWFWTYIFELHQKHDFFRDRAFRETPLVLIGIVGPALLLPLWALLRRPSAALAYAIWIGLVGFGVSCLAFGTQWAFTNAYIPGVFFPAIAIGVAAGRLLSVDPGDSVPRLRPLLVFALCAISIARLKFDPLPLVPTVADREAGDRLIARLRAAPGEVLIPFHPFYAHLAGKRTYLHRMGVLDVWRAGLGSPKGLSEAIRDRRWSLAIFDDKIAGTWMTWPRFLEAYKETTPPPSPRVVSGAMTHPRFAFVPK